VKEKTKLNAFKTRFSMKPQTEFSGNHSFQFHGQAQSRFSGIRTVLDISSGQKMSQDALAGAG
jgi:hypothetical protein